MQGLPLIWMQSKDELYNRLRGPAENLTILATAFDDPKFRGKGRHEPVLMTINYHEGRIFHSTLGHGREGLESVGFITTLLRGTEWAATGRVTLAIPDNFPSASNSVRKVITLK
jgi:type 1 glutamine amidotransferase